MSLDPHHRHHRAVDLCDELNADINLAIDMQPFLKLETVKALIPHEYADTFGGDKTKYIENFEEQATELESDIEDLESDIEDLKSKVDILRSTVDRHQEREDELESENTDFKNQVADLEQNVGALSRHIERLEDRIRDITS